MPKYAQVIIQFATVSEIDRCFTYKIPESLMEKVMTGSRVKVPFGRGSNTQIGYVMAIMDSIEETGYAIKSIIDILEDKPILSEEQLKLASFLVHYYGASYAASIDLILPPGVSEKSFLLKPPAVEYIELALSKEDTQVYIGQNIHKKTFKDQERVLTHLLRVGKDTRKHLIETLAITSSPITTLLKNKLLQKKEYVIPFTPDTPKKDLWKNLNADQEKAKSRIVEVLQENVYKGFLLEGVTGSGKTEVFLQAIHEVVVRKGQAIVLVPEIALTPQTKQRFYERFGNQVALTHSRMTPKERQILYQKAEAGEISIMIGPRSAVFTPFRNLRLIVVDEEHEGTYKSETTPKYSAIEVARMRMQYHQGVMLLASATPSIESYYRSLTGEYEKLLLPSRVGEAILPEVSIVDMRQELKDGNNSVISKKLYMEIKETLEQQNQVMLLLNRRGHSTFISCRSCGFVIKCKHCDIAMTYHASTKSLECHYCGSKVPIPTTCPDCDSKYIRFFGSGTEKVEEYLIQHFGQYGVGRMDFDTTSGKDGHSRILDAFRNKEINLLVGTQMIAKGHDFPNVTLVGIIAADMSLYMQDFRSEERTFQLLTQVLGRAGRGSKKGKVVIQTYSPDHRVIQMVKHHQQETFYQEELASRELMEYPPYTHLFTVLVTGRDEKKVVEKVHLLTEYLKYYNKKKLFRIIGPVAAVIGKIADDYRWRILIIGKDRELLLMFGKYCIEKFYKREDVSEVKIQWDIDPLQML